MPDLATVAETLPGFEVNSWYGLMAPAGTPRPIIDRVYRQTVIALGAPEVAAGLRSQGFDMVLSTPEQYADKIAADLRRWGELARATGIRIG